MSLELDRVGLSAGGRALIDTLSLRVRPGTLHLLLGPNGAGKSTALGLLAGDRRPTSGRVCLDGCDLADWPTTGLARRRAVMMQRDDLRFPFSVREIVALGRLPWHRNERSAAERAIVEQALTDAGASALADRRYLALSGGERARVQLARALAQITDPDLDAPPRYLLLDEPTASLDFAFQHQVMAQLRQCADRGLGVFAIVQDPNLALRHADEVSLITSGRLIASGAPTTVLNPAQLSALYGLTIIESRDARDRPYLLVEPSAP